MDGGRTDLAGEGTRAGRTPARGIVLDDWDDAPARTPPPRGSLFGARSPLARRIIAINIIALGALIVGILYLTQFEEALVAERERGLVAEARVIAQAVAMDAPDDFGSPAAHERSAAVARDYVARLGVSGTSRIRVYDREGRLLADSEDLPNAATVNLALPGGGARGPLDALRRWLREIGGRPGTVYNATLAPGRASEADVYRALEGRLAASRRLDADGRMIVSVALPLARNRAVMGAVMLSSRPGELDLLVSNQRAQLLQVFAIALMISVVLSLVLASTIATPLRRLAEAAEHGEARSSQLMNPERIRIPDLTARSDEIGYLSGAMRRMVEALYDRIEASEVFAADVAHEIKNPLTSLRSAVETLRLAPSEEARERLLAVIEKDVARLDRLVTDISNASRLDGEMVREEMQTFPITELLANLVEFNAPKAAERGARLVGVLPEEPVLISGIEGRLAQVFVNLIANAISFVGEGGEIRVALARMPDGGVRVTVEDTGPGIPDENLEDIFQRFYSERPQKEFGHHSGLGLAISRQIVEAHGGRIWAENIRDPGAGPDAPRRGARFVVELPQ